MLATESHEFRVYERVDSDVGTHQSELMVCLMMMSQII